MDNENIEKNDKSNMKKASIFDFAKQLENKTTSPASLSKQILKKCAELFKSRGYSNIDIGQILEVDEKTIQRYIKDQREENALIIGANFQRQLVGEVVRTWRSQYYRLLRLSYSEDLTSNEVMKSIYLAHQVQKDGIELLERLGYLSKATGIDDIRKAIEEDRFGKISKQEELEDALEKARNILKPAQIDQILKYLEDHGKEMEEKIRSMTARFIADNEQEENNQKTK